MEKIIVDQNINVFGMEVKTFPSGVGEAFDKLIKMLPNGFDRSFYGISYMEPGGKMVYIAAAEEREQGEAEKYNCEKYTIEKGTYIAEKITWWRQQLQCIKDTFHRMMQQENVNREKPAVEWYKSEEEMFCMVKELQTA
jgi:predicted transcriptional regulator YdeE